MVYQAYVAKVEKYKRYASSLLSFDLLGMGWSLTTVHGFLPKSGIATLNPLYNFALCYVLNAICSFYYIWALRKYSQARLKKIEFV